MRLIFVPYRRNSPELKGIGHRQLRFADAQGACGSPRGRSRTPPSGDPHTP